MQVTIEFTTDSFDYQVLKSDADFDDSFQDNEEVKQLVDRLHNSTTYEEREEIADKLWDLCGYDNAARMLLPEGRLEVIYEKSDKDDIDDSAFVILDNDWVDFDEFLEGVVDTTSFCIVKNAYAKRAHFFLETELDEPFNAEILRISHGAVSYKGEEFEFSGDAGGWIEENAIYVFGISSIEEEDAKIQRSRDDSQALWQTLRDKFSELLKEEISAYQTKSDEIKICNSFEMFAAWKETGIPDNGETNWDELVWKTQDYIFKNSDKAMLKKMEEKVSIDSQPYKDLNDLQSMTKLWEAPKDLIRKRYLVKDYLCIDPHTWEAVRKYMECQDIDTIKSWNQSTRGSILEMQSEVETLKEERDQKKMQRHTLFGYGVSGAYWDSTLEKSVAWESDEWFAVALDYHFHIEKYMISIGKGEIGFRGKDSDENSQRIQEWNDEMEKIDRNYDRRIDLIINSIKY